jgi:hypothetical protein
MRSIEEIVNELQQLCKDLDFAESKLFDRAHEIEVEEKESWQQVCATFDLFMQKFFIRHARRFREYIAAKEYRDVANNASTIGVSAVIQAAKIKNASRRHKFIEAAVQRLKETGAQWSDQQAQTERLHIGGSEPKDSAWNRRATEFNALKRDLIESKRKILKLEASIRDKDKEIVSLREQLVRMGGMKEKGASARKP